MSENNFRICKDYLKSWQISHSVFSAETGPLPLNRLYQQGKGIMWLLLLVRAQASPLFSVQVRLLTGEPLVLPAETSSAF